jgi:hypothetical protein
MPLPATGRHQQGQLASCRKYEPMSSIAKTGGYPIRYTLSFEIAAPASGLNKSISAAGDPARPRCFDVSRDYVAPLANFCSNRAQILPGGRCSVQVLPGSPKQATCVARCPEELVLKGWPSLIGPRHNSQRSTRCSVAQESAAGLGQSSQGPSRVRHVASLLWAAEFLAITKPPSVPDADGLALHLGFHPRAGILRG